jgi:hypothetical protein
MIKLMASGLQLKLSKGDDRKHLSSIDVHLSSLFIPTA